MNPTALTPSQIITALQAQSFGTPHNAYPEKMLSGTLSPAAVLVPLLWNEGQWEVLFIRRTEVEGDMHSGQVALPGGRQDTSDSTLESAALRETQEELAIQPKDVRILGQLNPFVAISNYIVTPFVGTIPWPYPITPEPKEVAKVFTIPLAWLSDPANHTHRQRTLSDGLGQVPVIYFEHYQEELLWGLSARIIIELLRVLKLQL